MDCRPFLKTRYRVLLGQQDAGDHWLGGKPSHDGAVCENCAMPFLLLWDMNCRDSRFPRGKFGRLKRLPLYFCWGCCGDLAYQIISDRKVKVLKSPYHYEGPNYQYPRYPRFFERRPIALTTSVPAAVRAVIKRVMVQQKIDPWLRKDLNARDQKLVNEVYGHPRVGLCYYMHHQFGGWPSGVLRGNYMWDRSRFSCPNAKCPRSGGGDWQKAPRFGMSFLAGVLNDPWGGLPMIERADESTKKDWSFHVTVGFHICPVCRTIHACSIPF